MNRRRLLRGTAYHEAGHAVTAFALGLQCPRISIALEPDGTGLFGRAMVTPPAGPPPRNYDCVALAGDVAGQMAGDQNGNGSHIVEVGDRIGLGELYRLQTLTHRYLRLVWPKVEAMAEAVWAEPDGVLRLGRRGEIFTAAEIASWPRFPWETGAAG